MVSQKDYLNNMIEIEKLFFIEEEDDNEDNNTEKRDKDYENKKKAIKKKLSFDTVKVITKNDKELDDIIDIMRNCKVDNRDIDNNKELFKKYKKDKQNGV